VPANTRPWVALWLGTLAAAGPDAAHAAPTLPGELTYPLDPAGSCEGCHAFGNPAPHADLPPYAPFGWQGSLMANAARDPVFWAGVAVASQDDPAHTDSCIRCHSPRAFLEGRGGAIAMDELAPADFDSVTCDVCHRQVDDGQTPAGNAAYVIDDTAVGPAVPKRGPWAYAGPPMPPHPAVQDAFVGTSRMCGTCHDVTTFRERVDDDGQPMGMAFNEQRTYSEWANSAYAQPGDDARTCQDCHMPAVADVSGCADFASMQLHPTGGRRHDLVGANRFVLEILRDLYGDTGTGEIQSIWFDRTLDRLDELAPTAATLEIEAPAQVAPSEGLSLVVRVTNETGHKLPTGYSEGRIAWLFVTATYQGTVVWSSGDHAPGEGPLGDPNLRTYQAVAENFATKATFHLLQNDHWVEDTRIPPKGLVPDPQTDPVTDRYPLLPSGTYAHYDEVTYPFEPTALEDATPDDPDDDVLEVRAQLLYLVNTNEYVDFLAAENVTNDAGTTVKTLFDERGGAAPVVLGEAIVQIPLSLQGATGGTSGGSGTGATTGTGTGTGTAAGTDTSGASEGDAGAGCGCTASRAPAAPAALSALVLFVALGRRRFGTGRPGPKRCRPPA